MNIKQHNTVLIGLGTIARYHYAGIMASGNYRLVAVCDVNEEAARNPIYCHLPFFADYRKMIEQVKPEVVVVATPPAFHYPIARYCIEHGCVPFVEKPLATDNAELNYFLSPRVTDRFVAVCHNLYGEEMLWVYENIHFSDIRRVKMELSDPYADAEGKIRADRLSLGGCWLDSGSNALAMLSGFVDLSTLKMIELTHQLDRKSQLPFASRLTAQSNTTQVEIEIHWDKGENYKKTTIEADSHYVLDHSAQQVFVDGELVFAYQGADERLTRHYKNFYKLAYQHPSAEVISELYKILLK